MELLISFSTAHPFLFFLLAGFAIACFYGLCTIVFGLPRMFMRFSIMRKYGYPPDHCDVDGKNLDDND